MTGWIKIHRAINSHWIWANPDYLKWWMDILIEVNHSDQKTLIKGVLFECKRGEKLYSYDTWAKRWGTNKSKVRRFLDMLEKDEMIVLKSETQTTRLTVCKYDSYQDERHGNETQTKRRRNADETQMTPIKECNNDKEDKIEFSVFWNLYNKKLGAKDKCEKIWLKLPFKEQEEILEFIPKFLKTINDKQYQPYPETFLNQRRWENEIQEIKPKTQHKPLNF